MSSKAIKRRKLDQDDAGQEEDSGSFASFSDSDVGDNAGEEDASGVSSANDADESSGDDDDMASDGVEAGPEGSDEEDMSVEDVEKTDSSRANGNTLKRKRGQADSKQNTSRNTMGAAGINAASMAMTGGNFKSNMFKIQLDELLGELRPRRGKLEEAAESALHDLKSTIETMPVKAPLSVVEAERSLVTTAKVAIPFPEPRPPHDAQYKLEFQRPATVNVTGSYGTKTSSAWDEILRIDMTVTMPESLFQEKDYLNHRYFYKRAYFIACIAAELRKRLHEKYHLEFISHNDDPLKPVIAVSPATQRKSGSKRWQILILPILSSQTFAHEKLLPWKNAIRPAKADVAVTTPLPTPYYNSSLQADLQVSAYLKLVHAAAKKCEAYKDACLIGRIWLRQRGLSSHTTGGGFGNFEFAAVMAILLETGGTGGSPVLSSGYSSYQLFKATLQYFGTRDLVKQPAILGGQHASTVKLGIPMLFDGSRAHNVLYKMTPWSLSNLRTQARASLTTLSDTLFDQFESAFIAREDVLHQKYDLAFAIPTQLLSSSSTPDSKVTDLHSKLHSVLFRGLDDRILQMSFRHHSHPAWELGSARPSWSTRGETIIALNLNPETASRTIDHGPSAESKKEAADFRRFWGEKAELRRFKDGSILESLLWTPDEQGETVAHQIIRYLVTKHFDVSVAASLRFLGEGFSRLVSHSNHSTAAFKSAIDGYRTLESDIRAMSDMPLSIRQIAASDAQLRYASVAIPSSTSTSKNPMNVIIQFESSGRWPDDLVAIQRTKTAFLLKMSSLFAASNPNVTSRVGLENSSKDTQILNQAYLDVTYPAAAPARSLTYRLRIHHDHEQTLLQKMLKDKTIHPSQRDVAAQGLSLFKRTYLRSPAHTAMLQKQCTRHSALSSAIRLTKTWFARHLLSAHFSDEVIELFVVRSFVHTAPYGRAPGTAKTGFLRTLSFLARWDWRAEPLIVDGSGDLSQEDIKGLQLRFEGWRKLDPAMERVTLYVSGGKEDSEGTTWTEGIKKVVAGRMSALAKACVDEVSRDELELKPERLFASATGDYDFVIHLSDAVIEGARKKSSKGDGMFKNLALQGMMEEGKVGFDAVKMFVGELESLYGDTMVLFHNIGSASRIVAGLWNPIVTSERPWKVNLSYSSMPVTPNSKPTSNVTLNRQAVLAEIARLGDDMIEKIVVNSKT